VGGTAHRIEEKFIVRFATILLAPLVAACFIIIGIVFAPSIARAEDDPPTPPAQGEAISAITEFQVTPARLRGRVDLGWQHPGPAEGEIFIVERSTNGSSWRSVSACSTPRTIPENGYACTDKRLTSGTTYTYRACVVAKGASCSSATATEAHTVKAP
jgi:hypothetical protein